MNFKRYILLIWLFIPIVLLSQSFYIGPSGSDVTGNGSRGNPWFSVAYAANRCSPGDSVIALSGTYNYSTGQVINKSGTAANYITIISEASHPDSVIFDFWTYDVSGEVPKSIYGIYSFGHSYLMFKGLTVKRLWKINTNNGRAHGFYMQNASHAIFDFCAVDSIAGRGFQVHNSADIFYYNCDAIWCADPQDADPGNAGSGFLSTKSGTGAGNMNDTILYQHCRAWYCSDQGFSAGDPFVIYDGCWSFAHGLHAQGYTSGGQHGMKPGFTYYDTDSIQVLIKNCIVAFNAGYGLNENTSSTGYKMNYRVYNNTFYKNGLDGIYTDAYSINMSNINKYVNNLSYDNGRYDMYIGQTAVHYYNSFDAPFCGSCGTKYIVSPATLNGTDFKALPANKEECVILLGTQRHTDGSLPDIGDYFQIAYGSELIDAGINVGLHYFGSAPDIGAFESGFGGSQAVPEYLNSIVQNTSPSIIEMYYSLSLSNIVPAPTAFIVKVNSIARTVNSVSVSGTKVLLTLSSAVVNGNVVTVAYTKPATNPLQTASGGQASSIAAQTVTNNVAAVIVPVYVSSVITNSSPSILEMTYNTTLANELPPTSSFTVMVNSVARTVSSVSVSGTKVLLTLSSPVVNGNVVIIAYTKPTTNPLQTASGGQAVNITAQPVINNVAAVIVPVYVSSAISNTSPSVLEMTYNTTLANAVPAASAFIVMVNSVARTVSSVSVSGTKVLLTLSSAVVYGNVATVAYTRPATNPLQTASGGLAASISAQTVTNNVSAQVPVYQSSVIENDTPSMLEMTYNLSLANIVPITSAFAVMVNSTSRSVSSVAISGTKVLLTLSSPVAYGNTVTVAYTKPATNPLQTTSGGQAETLSMKSVTNNLSPCITETFTSVSGTVTDNSGSSNYLNNMSCDKLIQPSGGGTITLTFTTFITEANYDFVRVYAGSTTSAPLLGTFSGTSLPPVLKSGAGSMLIRFTTDGSVVAAGWSATYTSSVSVGCIPETFTSVSGTVTDNSGSSNYLNNMSCDKLIQPSGGGTITLTFTSFITEANYDFVRVYAGSTTSAPLLGTFSGTSLPPVLKSSAGSMLIRFTTDGSVVAAGWSATYTSRKSGSANSTDDNYEQEILPEIGLAGNPDMTSEVPVADLVAYPNPTSGILNVKLSNNEDEMYTIHLINNSGQIILNQRMNVTGGKFEIDLSNIKTGFYLLRIMTDRTVQVISVIKH